MILKYEGCGKQFFFGLGNTCYLNSVLQVLRHTPDFRTDLAELADVVKKTMRELRVQGDEPLLDVRISSERLLCFK